MERDVGTFIDQEAPLKPTDFSEFFTRLAEAIGELHDRNLFWDHRERSIFVRSDGSIRIKGDFETRRKAFSPGEVDLERDFFPPECLNGGAHDARADIFALGALAYEAITGKGPLPGKSILESMTAMKHPEITPPDEIAEGCSPELSAVVVRMLSKSPEDRFQTISELLFAFRKFA